MSKKAWFFIITLLLLVSVGVFVAFNIDLVFSTIAPGLDNRITYLDTNNKGTEFVNLGLVNPLQPSSGSKWENDKFICVARSRNNFGNNFIQANKCAAKGGGGWVRCKTKKDFSGQEVYFKVKSEGALVELANCSISLHHGVYELIPDNLNIGAYNIYVNGEFLKRINIADNKLDLLFHTRETGCFALNYANIDYIKYVPPETFSMKNDEVWIKEVRKSNYDINNINWEFLGFHSEIRPATIRNLVEETEKPTPQIYINLINGLDVNVKDNEVHTFFYKTKFVEGMMDNSCIANPDKALEQQPDGSWKCISYIQETPIVQQCQTKEDCPILPECEEQKDLIKCNNENHLCDYTLFTPECKNQLITYQEIIKEVENIKFVSVPTGINSFNCFFDRNNPTCKIGEKTISVTPPKYNCEFPTDSIEVVATGKQPDSCWTTILSFNNKQIGFYNNLEVILDYNIKTEVSFGASYTEDKKLRDNWGMVVKITLPDNFLELKTKALGNKFVLKDNNEKITFIINNKIFGIDGGYTIQTQNLGLQGGVIMRNEKIPLFLNSGENEIIYDFKTNQIGEIVDLIGAFGKVTTDRDYELRSNQDGKQKFLVISKIVQNEIVDTEDVQPKIEYIEKEVIKEVEKPIIKTVIKIQDKIPTYVWWVMGLLILIILIGIWRKVK